MFISFLVLTLFVPAAFAQTPAKTKEANIVFGVYRPPYIFGNQNKGLDFEITELIMKRLSLPMKAEHSPNERALQEIALGKVDGVIGVAPEKNSEKLCYTKPLIYYDNVAISKAKSKIKLSKIADLKNLSFLSFSKATRYLGDEYAQLVSSLKKDTDTTNQMTQNKLFWADKVPVIILDLNVFKYYQQSLKDSVNTTDEVVIHRIFEMNANPRVAVFHDKTLCEQFDKSLQEIKANGEYQKLLDKYLFVTPTH